MPSGTETANILVHGVDGRTILGTFHILGTFQWKSGPGVDRHVTCHDHDAFRRLTGTYSDVQVQASLASCEPGGAMTRDESFEWNANGQLIEMATRHDNRARSP